MNITLKLVIVFLFLQICPYIVAAQWKLQKNDSYYYESLVSERLRQTFTFDSLDWLKAKLCEVKSFLTTVSFGVAAYDVEYDSFPKGCPETGIKSGPFNRLFGVQRLNNFLFKDYNGYPGCVGLNFSTSRVT
ncbi:hypothetical protein MRX96_050548 [Rhipicephalus microplus]